MLALSEAAALRVAVSVVVPPFSARLALFVERLTVGADESPAAGVALAIELFTYPPVSPLLLV